MRRVPLDLGDPRDPGYRDFRNPRYSGDPRDPGYRDPRDPRYSGDSRDPGDSDDPRDLGYRDPRFPGLLVLHGVLAALSFLLVLGAISGLACVPYDGQEELAADPVEEPLPIFAYETRVENAVWSACSTAILRGLSDQLVAEVECLRPGTMSPIDGLSGVFLGGAVLPYMQTRAAQALESAGRSGGIYVTSALRSLAQQYLLYRWYLAGRCGIPLAASPGNSNHESGLAIDVSNYSGARTALQNQGYSWFGSRDPVHFDYAGGGTTSLGGLSVLSFQRLWNRNNPGDRIGEDGVYGTQTANRLAKAPVNGFAIGPICGGFEPEPTYLPIEVYWARLADGSYQLHALAPNAVTRVDYLVGDYKIGSSTRTLGHNFPATYTFNYETVARVFEVKGYDANGAQVGLGVGLIDSVPGTAVYIKQMGLKLYEIGLERAPTEVAAIEVVVDGQFLLTDAVSDQTRSTRLAVRHTFSDLGQRTFQIHTFNADGTHRGTLTRTFTLR